MSSSLAITFSFFFSGLNICITNHIPTLNPFFISKIFNVVDDDPAPREEVFKYAADLVEKKWPGRFTERTSLVKLAPTVEIAGPRGEKRVSNARMKRELGVTLIHPSYRSGLCSIIEQMNIDDSGILGS